MTTQVDGRQTTRQRQTRPSNRKELILAAAAVCFRDQGYHEASMSSIADAVGIGPSALYRHYRGKQELFIAVLNESLALFERAMTGPTDWHDCVARVVDVAFDERPFGKLWDRDRGQLSAEQRAAFRGRIDAMATDLATLLPVEPAVDDARRQTIALAVLALVWLPSQRATALPIADRRRTLIAAIETVVTEGADRLSRRADQPAFMPNSPAPQRVLQPKSRREALLSAATNLISRNGYPNVGLDDIGNAAGIAGPSVYNYFESKSDIAVRILSRASESMWLDFDRILRAHADPADALDALVLGHTEFAAGHSALMRIVASQPGNLPESAQHLVDQNSREYVKEWINLAAQVRPDVEHRHVAFTVRCAIDIINGLAYLHRTRGDAVIADIVDLATAALGTSL